MNVQYLRDHTIRIPGRRFELRKVARRELGEAILGALDVRVEDWDAGDTLPTFASNCGEDGRVTIRGMTGGEVLAGPTRSRALYRAMYVRRVRRYGLIVSAVVAVVWMFSSC